MSKARYARRNESGVKKNWSGVSPRGRICPPLGRLYAVVRVQVFEIRLTIARENKPEAWTIHHAGKPRIVG
jgi:hypothetical protein